MTSSQSNKYMMAFLAIVFVILSFNLLSDAIFHNPKPEKEGFAIEAAETPSSNGETAKKEAIPIATLLQTADPARGAALFNKCTACHTNEKGGANKIGPHLWGVVNRPIASVSDFSYSAGMKEFSKENKVWDYEHLNHFLTSPKSYVKGTAMGFVGDKKDSQRADLIAYLRTLADNPEPLPETSARDGKPTNSH